VQRLPTDVPVEKLTLMFRPEPFTRWFDENLLASVREHGVLYPLLVAPLGDGHLVVDGERRYLAAREAGLEYVPCIEMPPSLTRGELERLRYDLSKTLKRFDETDFRHWRRRKRLEAGLPPDGDGGHWLPGGGVFESDRKRQAPPRAR
jgi:hypothetical protein